MKQILKFISSGCITGEREASLPTTEVPISPVFPFARVRIKTRIEPGPRRSEWVKKNVQGHTRRILERYAFRGRRKTTESVFQRKKHCGDYRLEDEGRRSPLLPIPRQPKTNQSLFRSTLVSKWKTIVLGQRQCAP